MSGLFDDAPYCSDVKCSLCKYQSLCDVEYNIGPNVDWNEEDSASQRKLDLIIKKYKLNKIREIMK